MSASAILRRIGSLKISLLRLRQLPTEHAESILGDHRLIFGHLAAVHDTDCPPGTNLEMNIT